MQFGSLPTPTPAPTATPQPTSPPSTGGLPTVQSTGWQHTGVTLRNCSNYQIDGTPGGTVIDGCDFSSGSAVTINGGGPVTLKRSRIRAMSPAGSGSVGVGIWVEAGAGPVTIEDVEVTSLDRNSPDRIDRTIGIGKNNTLPVLLNRVYVHDGSRGLEFTQQNNITVQDSYIAFNYNPPTNGDCSQERPHASVIRAAGGTYNIKILNTVLGGGECSITSGLIATYPEQGANHDILIDGGLWICPSGSPYGIAAGSNPSAGEPQNYGFTVKNLKISTQANPVGCAAGNGQHWNSASQYAGPLGDPKVWQNVTKYNPGKPDDGQPIDPEQTF